MNKKIFGYVISAIGIIALAMSSFPALQARAGISSISGTTLTITGIAITSLGIILILRLNSSKKEEVKDLPVYEGEQVIAYRRHRKK